MGHWKRLSQRGRGSHGGDAAFLVEVPEGLDVNSFLEEVLV